MKNFNIKLANAYLTAALKRNLKRKSYVNYYNNGSSGKAFEKMVMSEIADRNVTLEVKEEEEA